MRGSLPLSLLIVSACVGDIVEPDGQPQSDIDPSTASVTEAGDDEDSSSER